MKKVFLHREGAYGDHVHMSNVIRAFYEDGYQVDMLYNFKGAQVHTYNPMITNHYFFEAGAKDITPKSYKAHLEKMKRFRQEYDRFVSFQNSLERTLLPGEGQPEYFWPLWLRRAKTTDICFYDWSMIWAGLTDQKYMGRSGDVFFPVDDHDVILDWLDQWSDKYIILWALRGSMYQKAMYPIAEEICTEFITRHPETIIITTGDKFCQQWEWDHPNVIHRSGRIPFRQALCLSRYVDMVVTPETGLGIGAGSFGTPKIMLLTAASLTNIVGNDENDYSLQSPAYCSPCFRAIYNTDNCPVGPERCLTGKVIDKCSSDYGKEIGMRLPICIDFPKDMVLEQMEKIYDLQRDRHRTRPKAEIFI